MLIYRLAQATFRIPSVSGCAYSESSCFPENFFNYSMAALHLALEGLSLETHSRVLGINYIQSEGKDGGNGREETGRQTEHYSNKLKLSWKQPVARN